MVSKELVSCEVTKKTRRRRRRAGRAVKRRARKLAAVTVTTVVKSSPVKCAVHAFLLKYQSALRKVPTQLPPKIHAGPPSTRVKRVSWRKFVIPIIRNLNINGKTKLTMSYLTDNKVKKGSTFKFKQELILCVKIRFYFYFTLPIIK